MKAVYQLWGIAPPSPDWEELIRRTAELQAKFKAEAFICGLDAPADVYRRIRAIAESNGTKMYLWLPLFSELDAVADFDPLIDHQGHPFISERKTTGFRFRCPSSEKNISAMLNIYDQLLDRELFDGAFLDRIRFPSFQYGLSGIFSCFCSSCMAHYRALGLDSDQLRATCRNAESRILARKDNPLGMRSFDGTRWKFENKVLESFFDARCHIIEKALKRVCMHLRERGFSVGLDLFSPSLSYFTGQDFETLSKLADFTKPMLYLRTDAPAGLSYELRVMDEALGDKNLLMRLLQTDTLEALAAGESRRMSMIKATAGFSADIFCGVEYCSVQGITYVSPETLRNDIRLLQSANAEGIAGCWNLLYATPENISAFAEAF